MDFLILGPIEVRSGGASLPLGGAKQRTVLGNLLVEADRVVQTDVLIDRIWGAEPPPRAANALQVYVSQLRRVFDTAGGPQPIVTRAPGYVLQLDGHMLDARLFDDLVGRARGESPARRAAVLREALELWRGPALADFRYDSFAEAETARLDELRLVAFEELFDAELADGSGAGLVPELEVLVLDHPYRETFHAQLMLALYRAGRQADALAAYRRARRTLDDELGIEPGPRLQELERSILQQDPALLPAAVKEDEVAHEARRPVTVACVSLRTRGGDDLEAAAREHERRTARVAGALLRHGAEPELLPGGIVAALFGVSGRTGDAVRAVRAALDGVDLASEAAAAVTSGEALVVAGRPLRPSAVGGLLAEAVRRASAADAGTVVLDQRTARLSQDAVITADDGVVAGVRAEPVDERSRAPLVGRNCELEGLTEAFTGAAAGHGEVVVVAGEAGLGKSRLAAEFLAALGDGARRVWVECAGRPALQPLSAAVAPDTDAATPEELDWAVRQALATAAEELTTVVVLDDPAWPTDLAAGLARTARRSRLLVVCLVAEDDGASIRLEPLDDADAEALLDWSLGDAVLPARVRRAVLDTAAGNPFVIEQLAATLAAGGDASVVPPDVAALSLARLDGLDALERRLVEAAAVAGGAPTDHLAALLDEPSQAVSRAAYRLAAAGLLAERDGVWRVAHELIARTAYETSTKRRRAAWHERLADLGGDARHLGDAWRLFAEAGESEDATRIAPRAHVALASAGASALQRGDPQTAADLLAAATEIEPDVQLLVAYARALEQAHRPGAAADVLDRAAALATDARAEASILVRRLGLAHAPPVELASAATHVLGQVDDAGLRIEALRVLAAARREQGQIAAELTALDEALVLARSLGDEPMMFELLAASARALVDGPVPVPDALERCRTIATEAGAHPLVSVAAAAATDELEAMVGATVSPSSRPDTFGSDELVAHRALRAARIARRGGDPERARALLEEVLVDLHLPDAACAAELALTLARTDRDLAADWLRIAHLSSAGSFEAEVGEHEARSALALVDGALDRAVAEAEEAAAQTADTDRLSLAGDTHRRLAEVAAAAGLTDLADGARDRARAAYAAKGDRTGLLLLERG